MKQFSWDLHVASFPCFLVSCFLLLPSFFPCWCWPLLSSSCPFLLMVLLFCCHCLLSFLSVDLSRFASAIMVPSDTSTQRSTSLDDFSSDGSPLDRTNLLPPGTAPGPALGNHVRPYSNLVSSAAEIQHQALREHDNHHGPHRLEPVQPVLPVVPPRRCRMNMDVTVDLEALLPDGIQDVRTGQPVMNLDSILIFTFTNYAQLQELIVDYIKLSIQDLCWECFRLHIRKRDFKLWLQVIPPVLPAYPYGQYEPLDFDNHWIEVLNAHQIPFGQNSIHLRAHYPESILD